MQKTKDFFAKAFLIFGERLALLILFLVGTVVLFSQKPPQAFSASQQTVPFSIKNLTIVIPSPTPTNTPTPTPTPTMTPTPTPTPVPTADPTNDTIWEQIAQCESNGHWNDDTGNGYYGGLQFSQGAWNSVGGSGNPASASREEQIMRGKMLQRGRGWRVWGACAKKLGLD